MFQTRSLSRVVASVTVGLVLLGAGVGPAAAAQDPGYPTKGSTPSASCSLERVGTQLVRCDNLTGAGVKAPSYIPVR